MKATHKLAVVIGLGALVTFAHAKTPEEAYLEASQKGPGIPVPVSVVSPTNVGSEYAGASVKLKFTVDTNGKPTDFAVVSSPDAALASVIANAVSKWRFTPAQKNGAPVATKVVLPVHVSGSDGLAAN